MAQEYSVYMDYLIYIACPMARGLLNPKFGYHRSIMGIVLISHHVEVSRFLDGDESRSPRSRRTSTLQACRLFAQLSLLLEVYPGFVPFRLHASIALNWLTRSTAQRKRRLPGILSYSCMDSSALSKIIGVSASTRSQFSNHSRF